jgi:hypothetical protein
LHTDLLGPVTNLSLEHDSYNSDNNEETIKNAILARYSTSTEMRVSSIHLANEIRKPTNYLIP